VAVGYHAHAAKAQKTAAAVQAAGGKALAVKVDVTHEASVEAAVAKAARWGGRLDILVNNAAVYEDAAVWNMPLDRWRKVVDVDLTGAFLCTKHAGARMREAGWGRIVNVSSVVAQSPVFGVTNYAAAKAGLEGLTRAAALDLTAGGVTVNCIALGYFDRGMMSRLPPDIQTAIVKRIPMKRVGKASEAAALLLYLCSEGASYLTGQVIGLNGAHSF
jgi:3-oxoacyl-[acyl-carrier protein] reductase